eukprot:4594811-Pyramimonas_sp.AAC.1
MEEEAGKRRAKGERRPTRRLRRSSRSPRSIRRERPRAPSCRAFSRARAPPRCTPMCHRMRTKCDENHMRRYCWHHHVDKAMAEHGTRISAVGWMDVGWR